MSYTYTRHPPSPTRNTMEEASNPPGHRMGFIKRRDKLVSGPQGLTYTPYCSCGWKLLGPDSKPIWKRPKKHMDYEYYKHLQEVRNQGSLFDGHYASSGGASEGAV